MDGFKSIEIKNFRGIDHLEIDDCARVNVFLEQNNSGKTSILECLLLIMGMSSPNMPQSLNRLRSRNNMIGVADARYMFNNMVLANSPEIIALRTDGVQRHLVKQNIFGRTTPPLTTPAKKTKIYDYLEALLHDSKKDKNLIKEINRRYDNPLPWESQC